MNELKLSIHTELICRGSGKVFYLILTRFDSSCYSLVLSAESNNTIIPSSLFPYKIKNNTENQLAYVAVTPQTKDKQTLRFSLANTNKDLVFSSCEKSYSAQEIKWKSRLAYRTQPSLAAKIRNYDEERDPSHVSLHINECVSAGNEFIFHGTCRLPYNSRGNVKVVAFSTGCNSISSNYTAMGTNTVSSSYNQNLLYKHLQFSVHTKITSSFFLAVEDCETESLMTGFLAFEKHDTDKLLKESQLYSLNAQVDNSYHEWFLGQKTTPIQLAEQQSRHFSFLPKFSLVVPLFETPLNFFQEMVQSVVDQSYANWELVLINASPQNQELKNQAKQLADSNRKIKYIELEYNLGISLNTAEGIKHASGDYIAFFDHDDLIEPDLLFSYASALNEDPSIDVLYCDEDKLLPDGHYVQPFFKPDFSIDLLRNNNYICHMLTIRKSLLDQLPIKTNEFDGAQDHNLTLQASELTRSFHHVPKILYHWRINENSTAANADTKPYATIAGIKAVQNHLDRLGIPAKVSQSRRPFTYDVTYEVQGLPLVSIIIPTKDHIDLLSQCISSIIKKTTYPNYEIVLVENNSTKPETFIFYEHITNTYDNVKVVKWKHEFNFSKLINFGVKHSKGDYLILLNNDTELITNNWIEIMLGHCQRPEVGIVGVRLLYKDNTIQHAGLCVTGTVAGHLNRALPRGAFGYFALSDATQNLSAVTAACLMTSRIVFDKVKGFTETLAVAFNDVDYCLKVREFDQLVVYTPEVELYHYESISRGQEDIYDKKMRFHQEVSYMNYTWAKYYIAGDPYINPNFDSTEPYNRYYRLPHFD